MKRILKITGIIILIPVLVFIFLVVYATITDYRPQEKTVLPLQNPVADTLSDSITVNLLTWNIGYCGLDSNMDFFYDGGKKVRTPRPQLLKNLSNVIKFIRSKDSVDVFLIQEVDVSSKRSYHIHETDSLCSIYPKFNCFYGKNYDVFFVPVPPTDPMGGVNSGILALTRFNPRAVARYTFPGQYAWPKRLFMLDRCFVVMRFPLHNGKELLIINTHNEAYDKGYIRDAQMQYLHNFLLDEYAKGNYVIVGGDWNQCPPDFKPHFTGQVFDSIDMKDVKKDYLPDDWSWVYDNSQPSNRRVDISYKKGITNTTVIDFFLLSPNMKALKCHTIDLGFASSDHQPVAIKLKLK